MPKSPPKSSFLLTKWYLDCVSEEGNAVIGYVATLRWKALVLHYSSILVCRRDAPAVSFSSWQEHPVEAGADGASIRWEAAALGVEGTWIAEAPPIERVLLESPSGGIHWRCLQPRAGCRVVLASGEVIEGLGYAEQLALSIPPWRLPIEELRWGRFLSSSDTVVWIDWRGPLPLTLVMHNGKTVDGARVDDHELRFPKRGTRLDFEDRQVLREGPLLKTALSSLPGIQSLLPLRSLQTYECKWLSRGRLKEDGLESARGWTIHEVLRLAPSTLDEPSGLER